MSERELELYGEVAADLRPLLPVSAKLGAKYKRTRQDRAERFCEEVQNAAGVDAEGLETRLGRSEELLDVFTAAGARVMGVADASYRSQVARTVAAAFYDDAKIDEVGYLTAQLVDLEPVHLRVLDGLASQIHRHGEENPPSLVSTPRHPFQLSEELGVGPALVESALEVLEGHGLVTRDSRKPVEKYVNELIQDERRTGGTRDRFHVPRRLETATRYELTQWGHDALAYCRDIEPNDELS